jgi:hypothetical protein
MFIPTYVPQAPSPRAQELAQRLALAIAEYQQRNPDVSAEEIRAATRLAAEQLHARRGTPTVLIATLVGGVMALGGVLFAVRGAAHDVQVPWVAVVAGVIAVIGVIVAARSRS